jgi:AcrR family transcriptional regulator
MDPKSIAQPSRRKGRPVQTAEQVESVKAHISACAFRLFREEGYPAVSMRRLAQEAGCTVMTLYRYYPRKIDILRDLWAGVFNDLFDGLAQKTAAIPAPAQRLEAMAEAYVDYWLHRREHYFLVFMSSGITQEDVSVFVADDAILLRFRAFPATLAAALPGIDDATLALKSDLLLCTLNGIAHNLITISAYPWAPPAALVRAATRAILADG